MRWGNSSTQDQPTIQGSQVPIRHFGSLDHATKGSCGIPSYLIDSAADINPAWLQGAKAVGIAAGASAPEILVTEVVAFLRASEPSDVEELTVIEEDVEFLLPKELVQIESTKKSVVGIVG